MSSYQNRKSHCGDRTVVRSSYFHNGISYTGKMTSFYWISPLAIQFEFHNPGHKGDIYANTYSHRNLEQNMSNITTQADGHAPLGARPYSGIVMTKFLSNFHFLSYFHNTFVHNMMSFKMVNQILWNLQPFWASLANKYLVISTVVHVT